MRDSFARALADIAARDPRVMFLTADLGFGVFEKYKQERAGQYLNVGVAEQNLIAVATGLALEGRISFAYSIGNFPIMRCLEQIRNDAAYHAANVKVVSIGGGFSYGPLGMSHHATEDLSVMRAIPSVHTFIPGTVEEVGPIVEALVETPGTCYLRLDKSYGVESEDAEAFAVGKWRIMRNGTDACLITTGGVLGQVQLAANALAAAGISVRVVDANQLSNLDPKMIVNSLGTAPCVFTIEENVLPGGLGGLIAETLADMDHSKRLTRLGLQGFVSQVGSQQYLRRLCGLDSQAIASRVREVLAKS